MFGFFRRQSKKKKSKILNDIQCVPVDKYEIDFCRINTEQPEKTPRKKHENFAKQMGNSDSKKFNDNPGSSGFVKYENQELPKSWPAENEIQEFEENPEKQNRTEEILKNKTNKNESENRNHRIEDIEFIDEFEKNDAKCGTPPTTKTDKEDIKINKSLGNTVPKTSDLSSFNGVMTNETEITDSTNDKYAKQRQYSAEMSQDDTNNQDNFGTAPISPISEAKSVNQNMKISRERFFSFNEIEEKINQNEDSKPIAVATNEKNLIFIREENSTPVLKDFIQSLPKNNVSDVTYENTQMDSNDEEFFEEAENHSEEKSLKCDVTREECVETNKFNLDLSDKLYNSLPKHVEEFRNLKNSRIQIPDITITESSDSENENENESEGENEMDCYSNYYDRVYPSVLYDITEVDEPFSDASDMEFSYVEDDKRNIVHQESKFQDQIKNLKCEVESKDNENMQLRGKINDLQRDIMNKTWGMDRLRDELASFETEAECVRKKLLKVEEDLNRYKIKNTELNEELLKKLEYETDFKKVTVLQNEIDILKIRLSETQTELDTTKKEKEELQTKMNELENEKNEKIKTLQMALDDTLKQKQKMQTRFEEEYEKLRTVNSDREQQLLNDFEWKLREVELTCKKKLEDRDKTNEDKINQIRKQLENEIAELKEQLKEVEKIKSYEAEVTQLRGLTHEQQRSLRMATRTADQLQANERIMNEELERLRSSLEKERSHLATVQGIHSREIAEKDRKHSFKLEQQKNELNSEWEDKFRRETARLKLEMERTHKEEKRNLVEEAKQKTEKQLKENSQIWERKLSDGKKQLEQLEQKSAEKEDYYRKELLRLQTNSDRDMLELRRKLDKLDLSYQEQLEKKQEQHEKEIEILRENCEKRIQQSEQNWSQQVSSTRATLELVKEQLQREAEAQLEALSKKYMLQLEQQYERLMTDKEESITNIQEKYSKEMNDLQTQLCDELKYQKNKENELLEIINRLKEEINFKTENEQQLQENVDSLHETISELQGKLITYENLSKETDTLLRKQEKEHNEAILEIKEQYENEIKQWQSKFSTNKDSTSKEKSNECNPRPEDGNLSNIDRQSRSSRRKGRGKHRGQKNQHHPQFNSQFSSSSL